MIYIVSICFDEEICDPLAIVGQISHYAPTSPLPPSHLTTLTTSDTEYLSGSSRRQEILMAKIGPNWITMIRILT